MKSKIYKILGVALTMVLLASLTVGLAGAPAGAASSNLKWIKYPLPAVEDYGANFTSYFDAIDAVQFADSEGDFWCTPAADLGPIAQSPEGDVLFAAVADGKYNNSNWYHVLQSLDGGYSWFVTGFFDEVNPGDISTALTADITASTAPIPVDGTADFPGSGVLWIDDELISYTSTGANDFNLGSRGDYGTNAVAHLDGTPVSLYNFGAPIVDIVTSPEYGDDSTLIVATMAFVYISDDGGSSFIQLGNPWGGSITDADMTVASDGDLAIIVGTDAGELWVAKGLLAWTDQLMAGADAVLACGFLPTFAADGDIGIWAVVTNNDPSTTMTFSYADVGAGGEWGTAISNASFTNAYGVPFESDWARVAFPDDFDAFGIGNNVCFAGLVEDGFLGVLGTLFNEDGGSDAFRVVCKEGGPSSATDLDVRGVLTTLLPTSTPITSIDVCGEAEEATILVGTDLIDLTDTPACFSAYLSQDGGDSWIPSTGGPTGGAEGFPNLQYERVNTRVLMAPDFCDTGMAYASTFGYMTDAFQRTTDFCTSWNAISIIDYGWDPTAVAPGYAISVISAMNYVAEDTMKMVTLVDGDMGAVWFNNDGYFERILSYATPGAPDQISDLCNLDGETMFAIDYVDNSILRTTDGGATWPKTIYPKDNLMSISPVSATTIYTSHAGGEVWWTNRSGTGWHSPDDSEIPATATVWLVIYWYGEGDEALLTFGTDNGSVFISSDGGQTVERIGSAGPFGPGDWVGPPGPDLGFDGGGLMFTTAQGMPGIFRADVDLSSPGDAEWEQIDMYQDSTGAVYYGDTTFASGGPAIGLPPANVLYAIDAASVVTTLNAQEGGLWRCTNPTADTDSVAPPYFERETRGDLVGGEILVYLDLDLNPDTLAPTLFCQNVMAAYDEQLWMFTDILNAGVPLAMPAADETGVGLLPAGFVYPEVTLAWQEMAGATSYQYELAIDPDFKTMIPPGCGFTSSLAVGGIDLSPNMTYYWHVRVAAEGSLIGAPLISPWSETWKFKTAIGASMARPDLQAPWPGEPDVPLSPTFEWSGIEWAETYEYELAVDPATTAGGYFAEPLVALVGSSALVSTAWKCDIALDYETRYYWHVKAIGVDTDTPWSDVGTFTTMGVPPEPGEPVEPIVIPPQEVITPAWIWAIVIIGAILVIAVIVLIVTTRRVP